MGSVEHGPLISSLTWFLRPPDVTWVTNINTDLSYSWIMDLDMAHSRIMGFEDVLALGVEELLTQVSMALVATKASGHGPDPGFLCNL